VTKEPWRRLVLRFAGGIAAALAIAACSSGGHDAPSPSASPTVAEARPDAQRSPDANADSDAPDADLLPEAERAAIRRTIATQLEALSRDDGEAAFSFAAPAIRQMFGTPERFLAMVRTQYAPLYHARRVRFGEVTLVAGEVTQRVSVIAENGVPATALYLMDRQSDGEWKILGCLLVPANEAPA
jgi:hypothetical protein